MAKAGGRAGGGGGGSIGAGGVAPITVVGSRDEDDLMNPLGFETSAQDRLRSSVESETGSSGWTSRAHSEAATRATRVATEEGIRNPIITHSTPSPGTFRTTIRAGRTSASVTTRKGKGGGPDTVTSAVRIKGRAISRGTARYIGGAGGTERDLRRARFHRALGERFMEAIRMGR